MIIVAIVILIFLAFVEYFIINFLNKSLKKQQEISMEFSTKKNEILKKYMKLEEENESLKVKLDDTMKKFTEVKKKTLTTKEK